MSKSTTVKLIHTNFILEVNLDGIEYHVTTSEDLKEIYDIDVLSRERLGSVGVGNTEMREVIWGEFMNGQLDLER